MKRIIIENDSEFYQLKRSYPKLKKFKDIDKDSGTIRDLIDDLENKGISYDIYTHKSDNGLTVFYESADNALVLDKENDSTIASQVSMNIKAEWDAIQGYDLLIPFLESKNDYESIEVVRDIIADEKAHADKLRKVLMKYDGGILPED